MPRRFLSGLPTTSSAPNSDPPDGTRPRLTRTVARFPGASEKRLVLTDTPASRRARFALTTPFFAWRQGRGVTLTLSVPAVVFLTVAVALAPAFAVTAIDAGETDTPPWPVASGAAAAIWQTAIPAAATATGTSLLRDSITFLLMGRRRTG